MAFEWVIRHQKKALFVLAAVLIVGWGISGIIGNLMSGGRQRGPSDAMARIAGEAVTHGQFQRFRATWVAVFPDLVGPDGVRRHYPGQSVTPEQVALGWYALLVMGRQYGMQVSDEWVLDYKRRLYQGWTRNPEARFDETAQAIVRKSMGVTGPTLDRVVREFLIAQKMLGHILGGLQGTQAEAWEYYARENRDVRVRYVTFPASAFRARVPVPDNAQVEAWYESHKGAGSDYYTPPTAQIEYAQLILAKLGADVTVGTEEMKKFYDENQDLYKLPVKEGQPADYIVFPEVRPEIEEQLKRRIVNERATKILDDLRQAFSLAPAGTSLEDVVKKLNVPALDFFRTPFLTDVQLIELAGIGVAHAEGRGLAQLAFERGLLPQTLSPVLSTVDVRWVFRLAGPVREGKVPALPEVRDRVVDDIRRQEALKLAVVAAGVFDNDVRKAGGAAGVFDNDVRKAGDAAAFEKLAQERKLPVTETPFFRNNLFDANRPDFIDRTSDLPLGKVHGPWTSTRDAVAAVLKVIDERPVDRAGFEGEMVLKRSYALTEKRSEYPRRILPHVILAFAGYKDLREKDALSEEEYPFEETPPPAGGPASPDNQPVTGAPATTDNQPAAPAKPGGP